MPEEQVFLNIYQLDIKGIWKKAGIYHTGVEVYGQEFMFGGHPENKSGITSVRPKQACDYNNIFIYKKCINMGTTKYDKRTIFRVIEQLGSHFSGINYHLLKRNCNNFSDEFCKRIVGKGIPKKYNRIARIVNCIPLFYKIIPEQRFTFKNIDDNNERSSMISGNGTISFDLIFNNQPISSEMTSTISSIIIKNNLSKKDNLENTPFTFSKENEIEMSKRIKMKLCKSITENQTINKEKCEKIINFIRTSVNRTKNSLLH
uniref:DUF862 domain-containing protein n=1 Tax=Parastrongyloides trichosuri TaxID=131310 RepID=A0A0N4ZE28_PARTI